MDVRTLKLISIPLVAAVNFITGFLPYFFIIRKIRRLSHKPDQNSTVNEAAIISPTMKRFLTLANFFCGGVFLSTCIIGLYPGVNSKFNNIIKKNPTILHYPYAGLSLAFGFFFVWLLEILVHHCIHCHSHASHKHHSHSLDHDHHSNNVAKKPDVIELIDLVPEVKNTLLNNCEEEVSGPVVESGDHEPHSHVPLSGNLLGSVMLTFALGSHSIIEGLGFGVMDELSLTVNMLVTVLIHESVCAISLGVNIASKRTSMKAAAVLLAIFSILIPTGIGLGLIVDSSLQNNFLGEVVVAVLQGVAAGTFIYVVFMEILPNEMAHRKDALPRLLAMALGFAVIAAMKASHSHGDGPRSANLTALLGPANLTAFLRPSTSAHTH